MDVLSNILHNYEVNKSVRLKAFIIASEFSGSNLLKFYGLMHSIHGFFNIPL